MGAKEEGDAGLVEEKSSSAELEMEVSPRFGVHESFPG